jgi:hypothetical protein
MSTSTARLIALPFALSAFGLRLLVTFRITPLAWQIKPWPAAFGVWAGALLAAASLPLAGYLLLIRPARRRPATWQLRPDRQPEPGGPGGPRFVASSAPRWVGPWAIVLGWLAGSLPITEREPGGDRMRLATFDHLLAVRIGLVGVAALLLVLLVAADRPRLTLDRAGVRVDGNLRRPLLLRWDELVPGGPPPPAKRHPDRIVVHRAAAGRASPAALPAGRLQVDSAFLAHPLRDYTERPDQRGTIGTESGLAALRTSFHPEQGRPVQILIS